MESKNYSKVSKFLPNKRLLSIFYTLVDGSDGKRIITSQKLIDILNESPKQAAGVWPELDYTVTRLVKGLASTRKWARLGYSVALTQVLREFPVLDVAHMLSKMKSELRVMKSDSKADHSQTQLGQVMVYLALIQSDKILQASGEEMREMTEAILSIQKKKQPLHQICTQALIQLVAKTPEEVFSEHVFPVLKPTLTCGWEQCTPDSLLLLLHATTHQHKRVGKKLLRKHWSSEVILSKDNFEAIGKVMMQSTSDHPIIHPVCVELVKELFKTPQLLAAFWKQVIEGQLLQENTQRKYLCFQLVGEALKMMKQPEQVSVIVSPGILSCLMRNLGDKKLPLFGAAKQLVHEMVTAQQNVSSSNGLQVAFIKVLISPPGTVVFDNICKTSAVAMMVRNLHKNEAQQFSEYLMGLIRGEQNLDGEKIPHDREVIRKFAVQQLNTMVTQVAMATDTSWQLNILQFLFLHGFFTIRKQSDAIMHCDMQCKYEFSQSLRHAIQASFFQALNKLATFQPEKKTTTKDHRPYINILYQIAKYAQSLLQSPKNVSSFRVLGPEVIEEWKKILSTVETIREKHKEESKLSEGHAFELLFLHLGLQLFTDPAVAMESLEDLHVCYDRAFQKKKKKSTSKEDLEEPEWVEVITELLLSLMSQQSHLVRVVVNTVFSMLSPHLTKAALQLILDVMKPSLDEDGPLAFEDEDEDMGSGDENGVDKDSSQSSGDKDMEEEEEEEDSSSDEEEEEKDLVQEKLKMDVKKALGNAVVDSEDEESELSDLSDSEMFKLDDALSRVFKNMRKGKKDDKERELQLKHFKLRCLDLIQTFIQNTTSPHMLLDLLLPLLELKESAAKDKNQKELSDKLSNTFRHLCKPKKMPADVSVERNSLPGIVQKLVQFSAKVSDVPLVRDIASGCLLVVRIMLGDDGGVTGASPGKPDTPKAGNKHTNKQNKKNLNKVHTILNEALKDFCEKRDSRYNAILFHTILERQPALLWPVTSSLLTYLKNPEIRIFCRTQVCGMLAAMISKKVIEDIGGETWELFAKALTPHLCKVVATVQSDKDIKPKFLHEVLMVLYRVLTCTTGELLKTLLPSDLVSPIQHLKKTGATDTKRLCNKITGQLVFKLKTEIPKEEKGKGKKQKRKDSLDGGSPKKAKMDTSLNDSVSSPSTQEKKKKKKEKRKSMETKEEVRETVPEENNKGDSSDVGGSSKKKKKRKSIEKEVEKDTENSAPTSSPLKSPKMKNSVDDSQQLLNESTNLSTAEKKKKKKQKRKSTETAEEELMGNGAETVIPSPTSTPSDGSSKKKKKKRKSVEKEEPDSPVKRLFSPTKSPQNTPKHLSQEISNEKNGDTVEKPKSHKKKRPLSVI